MRRRSRIGPAAFAAGLLIALIIALWTFHIGLWSPEVEPTAADHEQPVPVYKPDPLPAREDRPAEVPKLPPPEPPVPTEQRRPPPPSEASRSGGSGRSGRNPSRRTTCTTRTA